MGRGLILVFCKELSRLKREAFGTFVTLGLEVSL